MAERKFDLVIVGGGMIGASLALALGGQFKLALIEATWPKQNTETDGRVTSLNLASVNLLKQLGVWDHVVSAHPYTAVEVWEEGSPLLRFSAMDMAADQLGFMVENRLVRLALLKKIKANKHIHLLATKLAAIDKAKGETRVELADGSYLRTSLVIGADGVHSLVRQQAGIGLIKLEREQVAVVVLIKTNANASTTWQRFTPEGAQAFLPLSDKRALLVWYVSPLYARQLISFNDKKFLAHLCQAYPDRINKPTIEKRAMFPISAHHTKNYVSGQTVLIGDAAHAFHPLAGQGANFGFLDVQVLAELLRKPADINPQQLAEYQHRRYSHNLSFMLALEVLNYGFSNMAWHQLRHHAVKIAGLPFMRKLLMKEAEGDPSSLLASLYKLY